MRKRQRGGGWGFCGSRLFFMRISKFEYQAYLRSEAWQVVRRRFFASKLWKGRCYACEQNVPVDLHHRSYARLGYEKLSDLVPLCRRCHKATHELLKQPSKKPMTLYRLHRKTRGLARHNWIPVGMRGPKINQEQALETFQRRENYVAFTLALVLSRRPRKTFLS